MAFILKLFFLLYKRRKKGQKLVFKFLVLLCFNSFSIQSDFFTPTIAITF